MAVAPPPPPGPTLSIMQALLLDQAKRGYELQFYFCAGKSIFQY